ncbi:MAG TPA: hypothetical protein GX703_05810 [Erysipelothrix sp.]|nr:hypothetical protein [Erysipelothrix sp.]
MFFNKGKRVLKEYNWLKRTIAWALVIGLLLLVNYIVEIKLWQWIVLLFHSFTVLLWYGSQVKMESITIGLRFSLFYFLFSLSLQNRHEGLSYLTLLLSLNYIILLMISSWSLPRVKLGLDRIKAVGSLKLSIPFILITYNGLMYFLVSKNWFNNLLSSLAILTGFILLYSVYSRKNIINFIGLTFIVHQLLFEYSLYNTFSVIEYIIISVIYIVFIIIQFYTKTKKKEG